MNRFLFFIVLIIFSDLLSAQEISQIKKTRVIVTTDGEIDDECSMVRFLLYANEWDIEGIITSSSQYHWHGHKWAGDDWIDPSYNAYEKVYPNLIKHDTNYPTVSYLKSHTFLGNVETEGEMDSITLGSQHIVKVLLDKSDNRPIWIQAWGGTNTIARALKTIEEDFPHEMDYVAEKIRFFFIWEQDDTYQSYIRKNWGKYNILTIISDQFEAIAYRWKKVQPKEMQPYLEGGWMKKNILEDHGPLCTSYKSHENGDFRSEGDSPAFLHTIDTGLRNMDSPNWGGWGGRYVYVRENTWLDFVPDSEYKYPKGRWYGSTGWGRNSLRKKTTTTEEQRNEYFKPMYRWTKALQNDFAARADWCVKPFNEVNHPPVVKLTHAEDLKVKSGHTIKLNAFGTSDPDGDKLEYNWWQYKESGSYEGAINIENSNNYKITLKVPNDCKRGETIHIICEVKDNGIPQLTRYKRVILEVE